MVATEASSNCRWSALTDNQRAFLRAAYDMDRAVPRCDGIAVLKWRTVGAMCGLTAGEADRVVAELSDVQLVQVDNADRHTLLLRGRSFVSDVLDNQRRRRWNWVLVITAAVSALVGLLSGYGR